MAPVAFGPSIPENASIFCRAMRTACILCVSLQMAFGSLQRPRIFLPEFGVPCLVSASILLSMEVSSPWPSSPEVANKGAKQCTWRVHVDIQEVLGCDVLTDIAEPGCNSI
mmetsp:Transcript_80440/g.202359  ORF Transcript_80440/g.202359 Transcript_80440/m.202359 type:complete len:111 (-) Transcript_80440:356-688(-)